MFKKPNDFDLNLANQIQEDISEEIFKAAKIPEIKLLRRAIQPFIKLPVRRFSEFIARIDALIEKFGFVYASRIALKGLCQDLTSLGAEKIPLKGPLIIASNHPGAYDGFVIISQLPRNDFKVLVSGIPFFKNLPNASQHTIYSTHDPRVRMEAVRKSIRHLENGGSIIIFPSGRIDPDPSIFPDPEKDLKRWSRSIGVFMKKVPASKLVLAITSGVLSEKYLHHPFPKLFRNDHERRRIMEFMQVIKQMVREEPVDLFPKITFGSPIFSNALNNTEDQDIDNLILSQAVQLLKFHKECFY